MKKVILSLILPVLLSATTFGQIIDTKSEGDAWAVLQRGLNDTNPDDRVQAVLSLSLAGTGQDIYPWLERALADKDYKVRLAAVSSLGELNDKRSYRLLKFALNSDTPEVVFSAAKALYDLDQPEGREVLQSIISKEQKTNSSAFTSQKRDTLRMMKTPSGFFKLFTKYGVGFVPLPGLGTGMSAMNTVMSDSGVNGRAVAVALLAEDKDPETAKVLRQALQDENWTVRAAAVHAFAVRNDPKAIPDILPLFDDKKEAVQYRAAAAYLRLHSLQPNHRRTRRSSATP